MRLRCSLLLLLPLTASAQDYTTPDQFTLRVDTDLVYGTDTNYLGLIDTLRLDLFTPNGNTDTKRPLAVFVHGGNWLGGCKDDPAGIVPLLHQFVKRGYVVASVNYRLGWQKDDFVSDTVAGWPFSLWPAHYRSFYALDSAELKRAIYRGMQDVKGAIRWLKARADQDSVCVDKVFVGGESAGGFVALATAFLDRAAEKPDVCGALPDALPPYYKTLNGTAFECVLDSFAVSASMLARPDLGPVEGDLNINGFDASVQGVANFHGGVPYDAFALDWWQGADTPSVYLYHQTCDGIVLFNRGQPISTISGYCNLGSTPWHYNYPFLFGSGAINTAFDAMTAPPSHTTDLETCASFDPNFALFECNRYANNGSYHYTANHALRGQNLSAFWEPSASDANACLGMGIARSNAPTALSVFPQPAVDHVSVQHAALLGEVDLRLMTSDGRVMLEQRIVYCAGSFVLHLPGTLANGCYVLALRTRSGVLATPLLLAR